MLPKCAHVIWIFRMLPNYNPKFIIIYFEGDLAQKVNRLWRGLKVFKSRVLYAVRALGIVWDGKNAARADNLQKSNVWGKNGLLAGKSKAARRLQRWMKNITVMKAIISTAPPVSLECSMAESPKDRAFLQTFDFSPQTLPCDTRAERPKTGGFWSAPRACLR